MKNESKDYQEDVEKIPYDDIRVKRTIKAIRKQVKQKYPTMDKDGIDWLILTAFHQAYLNNQMSAEDLCALNMAMGHKPSKDLVERAELERKLYGS